MISVAVVAAVSLMMLQLYLPHDAAVAVINAVVSACAVQVVKMLQLHW